VLDEYLVLTGSAVRREHGFSASAYLVGLSVDLGRRLGADDVVELAHR
jgi:hypothetical protein